MFTSVVQRRERRIGGGGGGMMGGSRSSRWKRRMRKHKDKMRERMTGVKTKTKNKVGEFKGADGKKKIAKMAAKQMGKTAMDIGKEMAADAAMSAIMGDFDSVDSSSSSSPPNKADVRATALNAGLNTIENTIMGNTGKKRIKSSIVRGTATPQQRRANQLDALKRFSRLFTYMRGRNKARQRQLYRGIRHTRVKPQAFGTGRRGKKGKKKKKPARGRKKKKIGKKGKTTKKGRKRVKKGRVAKRKSGMRKMNIMASRARYQRLRDVFTV